MVDREVTRGDGWRLTIMNGKLLRALAQKPKLLDLNMRKQFNIIAPHLMKDASINWPRYTDGPKPRSAKIASRSGKLQQSIKGIPKGTKLSDLRIFLKAGGVTAPYAPVQEYGTLGAGGTLPDIRSKRPGGKLTIPLSPTLTSVGVLKRAFKLRVIGKTRTGRNKWGTDRGPTFIAGNAIMQAPKGKRGKAYPIYALKDRVAVPPRLGLFKTLTRNEAFIKKRILRAIDLTLKPKGAK